MRKPVGKRLLPPAKVGKLPLDSTVRWPTLSTPQVCYVMNSFSLTRIACRNTASPMIERLEVTNYRLFERFEVGQLGRINIFSGKNNSGKTTLLETLFLLGSAGNPNVMMTKEIVRNIAFDKHRVGVTVDILWKSLFNNLEMTKEFSLKAWHAVHGFTSLSGVVKFAKQINLPVKENIQKMQSSFSRGRSIELKYRHKNLEFSTSILEVQGALNMNLADYEPPYEVRIVSAGEPIDKADSTAFGSLRQSKRSGLVLQTLQSMDRRIVSIEESSTSGEPMIWADIGLKELVPLSALGNGIARTAKLMTAMLHCQHGVLLVDEVENGFHYSFLPKLWRAIDEASRRFNVQVIATTHSYECVYATLDLRHFGDFRYHRLDRDDSSVRCVTYEPEELTTSAELQLEIR